MMPGYTMLPLGEIIEDYCLRMRFSRRIRFLRHFQRIFRRFFHTRELRFIELPLVYTQP